MIHVTMDGVNFEITSAIHRSDLDIPRHLEVDDAVTTHLESETQPLLKYYYDLPGIIQMSLSAKK